MMGRQIITEIRKAGMTPGQFVELSNGRTHYLLEGPEDGPLIVFFHGFGVFSYVYVVATYCQRQLPLPPCVLQIPPTVRTVDRSGLPGACL